MRAEAIEQLAGYVRDRTKELGQRYAGILTDGQEWALYHLNQSSGDLHDISTIAVSPADPNIDGLLVWLEGVLSSAEQLVPTPREVQRRLGSDAPGFELDLAELRDVYEQIRDEPRFGKNASCGPASWRRHLDGTSTMTISCSSSTRTWYLQPK